jgi:predicted methyltransferase
MNDLHRVPILRTALCAVTWFTLAFIASACGNRQNTPSFEQETTRLANALELSPGMTVADVGAGEGKYSVFLADQVGNSGKVYSTEVAEELLGKIRGNVADRRNVTVILGKGESTELPPQCCDRILLRRVFHHLEHPEPMLRSLYSSLRPGGVIAIVDFLRAETDVGRSDATPGDHEHGVRVHHLIEEMQKAGFEFIGQVDDWPSRIIDGEATDFCILFRRSA